MSSKMPSDNESSSKNNSNAESKEDKSTVNNPGWVQFDEDAQKGTSSPAVIPTESVQVNLERGSVPKTVVKPLPNDTVIPVEPISTLRTVELGGEVVRQGFANGDCVVTLLPTNTRWPWITPAKFRPELVPEELMAQGLTLTVEEYVQAMELLVNDVRFTMYNICYKRILVLWIILAFTVLFGLLFSGLKGLTLFVLGVAWLILNAAAIFISIWIKIRLARGLERCLAHVNKQLLRHKLVIALDDRGKISCHKVNLCFLYLDPGPCIAHLQATIEQHEREPTIGNGWEQRMDIVAEDIVIQGSHTTRLSRKQERAALLHLRYASRWAKEAVRGYLTCPTKPARHCPKFSCPCQFIEEHLHYKPEGKLTLAKLCCLPEQK